MLLFIKESQTLNSKIIIMEYKFKVFLNVFSLRSYLVYIPFLRTKLQNNWVDVIDVLVKVVIWKKNKDSKRVWESLRN